MKGTSQGKNDKYGNWLVSLGSKLRHLFIYFIFRKETFYQFVFVKDLLVVQIFGENNQFGIRRNVVDLVLKIVG